ncbi:hypothetical protein [Herbaspirillum sp. SJZ099]|uniref:hypothetical protein n=1 Tax=Herbaspirillum sp. SJZ099 TaxID=2572916 RepID=UPI00119FFF10|nr:hypothetical protein [Herbaspirillum sp. SJZ099]TWC69947.1 hypothetical protein FB597_102554 [Herbaspirillum sp. SJZ099]
MNSPANSDAVVERQREHYAEELRTRFTDYKRWAMSNWPVKEQALTDAAFVAAERELELITGAMLHPGRKPDTASMGTGQQSQFEDVTPAPWP